MTLRALILLSATLLLALLILMFYSHGLLQEKNALSREVDALTLQIKSRDQLIEQLDQQMQQREQAELALRQALGQASKLTLQREQQFQRSQDDDPTVKAWAERPLPAAVSQLHQRPDFPTATDYLRWLSGRQPLPDTRQSAK
ncbi:hypothetical protein AwEntero_23900 [Enterobacterales bacterium]|nr:hypothetical protein AwEntero_23900 [Enterobacterales bacterium]